MACIDNEVSRLVTLRIFKIQPAKYSLGYSAMQMVGSLKQNAVPTKEF